MTQKSNAARWIILGFIHLILATLLLNSKMVFQRFFAKPEIVLNEETRLVFRPHRKTSNRDVYLRTMQCDKIGEVKTQLLVIRAGATQLLWNGSYKKDYPTPTQTATRRDLTVCTSAVLYQPGEQAGLMVPSLSFGYGEFFSPIQEEPLDSSEARLDKRSKEKLTPIPDTDVTVNPQVGVIEIKGVPSGFRLGKGEQAVVVHAQAIGTLRTTGRMQSSEERNIQSLENAIAVSKKHPELTFVVMTLAAIN